MAFKINASNLSSFSKSHAKLMVDGVEAIVGTEVKYGSVLTAVSNSGYEFFENSVVLASQDMEDGSMIYGKFTTNEPPTTATLRVTYNYAYASFSVAANSVAIEVKGSNNVYKINNKILNKVNKERFVVIDDKVVDYGSYILSVIQVPTVLDSSLVLEESKIRLGNVEISASAPVVSTDTIKIDLGEIKVPRKYNTDLDFSNVVCRVNLPHTEPFALEPTYVIGETLKIEYILDVYTGQVTINIFSSKINDVFFTKQSELGFNVPYSNQVGYNANVQNTQIVLGGDNHIKTPFVEIVRNKSPLLDKFFSVPVKVSESMGAQSGYVEIENINLNFPALSGEKSDLKSILSGGVIVND